MKNFLNTLKKIASLLPLVYLGLFNVAHAIQTGLDETAGEAGLIGRGATAVALPVLIGKIVAIALELVGVVFLVLVVYAGFMWMMARENADQAKKAMTLLKNAVIGLVIIAAGYALTSFILTRILTATGVSA